MAEAAAVESNASTTAHGAVTVLQSRVWTDVASALEEVSANLLVDNPMVETAFAAAERAVAENNPDAAAAAVAALVEAVRTVAAESTPPSTPPTTTDEHSSISLPSDETEPKKKKRAKGKPLYPQPEPKEGMNSGERITNIKSKLRKVSTKNNKRKGLFLHHLNKAVIIINQMKVKVSMLAKQLCLRLLEGDCPLPKFNQQFYSGLYTAIKKGKWKHDHDDLLQQHYVGVPPYKAVVRQAMDLAATSFAAQIETHYKMHYEGFYKRWRKWKDTTITTPNNNNNDEPDEFFLDPNTTDLRILIRAA